MATSGFQAGGGYGGAGTMTLPRPAAPAPTPLARPLTTPRPGQTAPRPAASILGGGPALGVSNNPNARPAASTGDWNALHPARAAWRAAHPTWATNHPITMGARQQANLYGQSILPDTRKQWAQSRRDSIPQTVLDQGGLAASLAWQPSATAGVLPYMPPSPAAGPTGQGGGALGNLDEYYAQMAGQQQPLPAM